MKKHTPGVECDVCGSWADSKVANTQRWLHVDLRVYGATGKKAQIMDFCSAKCVRKWSTSKETGYFVQVPIEEEAPAPLKKRKKKVTTPAETPVEEQIEVPVGDDVEIDKEIDEDASA